LLLNSSKEAAIR
jgi:hypothetical protein